MTDDERMRQIRERAATWRQMGDCGDDGPIAIALHLLERLDAERARCAAIAKHVELHNLQRATMNRDSASRRVSNAARTIRQRIESGEVPT